MIARNSPDPALVMWPSFAGPPLWLTVCRELVRVPKTGDVADRCVDVCGHEFADTGDRSQAPDDVDVLGQRSNLHIDVGTFLGEQVDAALAQRSRKLRVRGYLLDQ
jgi:hypothetical protein